MNLRVAVFYIVFGQLIAVSILVAGIFIYDFAPICDVLLAPGSKLTNIFPGGGMHNPIANVLGFVANGVLYSIPFFMFRLVCKRTDA